MFIVAYLIEYEGVCVAIIRVCYKENRVKFVGKLSSFRNGSYQDPKMSVISDQFDHSHLVLDIHQPKIPVKLPVFFKSY